MPFKSIDDYHNACRVQILADSQIGVRSLYLPNTYFSREPKPKYCLIASEPSLSALGEIGFQALIDQGMTNFMYSRGDFMLHYCAFEFLCGHEFDFVITDLAKGAMAVNNANLNRTQRYDRWLPILRDELDFYGNPPRIAVGRIAETYLRRRSLGSVYVRHYSGNNYGDFTEYWNAHPADHHLASRLDDNLREFMKKKLFLKTNYPKELRRAALARVFNISLPTAIKGMYLEYREVFMHSRDSATREKL
jgi:hypothetical protein